MDDNVTTLPPAQNQNDPQLIGWNRACISAAFDAIYSTTIYKQDAAALRGNAIQCLNRMCEKLGFDDLVRED